MLTVRKRIPANLNNDAEQKYEGRFHMKNKMAEFAKSSTTSFLLNIQYFLNRNFVTRTTNSQSNERNYYKDVRVSETVGETRKIDRSRNSQVPLKTALYRESESYK